MFEGEILSNLQEYVSNSFKIPLTCFHLPIGQLKTNIKFKYVNLYSFF